MLLMEKTSKVSLDDEEMRGAFAAFDKDGNGTIDKAELMVKFREHSSILYIVILSFVMLFHGNHTQLHFSLNLC